MKSTATTGTDGAPNVTGYVFARQAIRQWLTSWCRFGAVIIDARRQRRLHPGNVDIEIFQSERKLITVQSLRTLAKLRTLQVMNDRTKTLDLGARSLQLGPLIGGLRGHVAYQPMQSIDIGGERGEIEIHARESNPSLRRHPR
jgi:hypothetical protein